MPNMILPSVHYAAVLVLTAIAITGNSQCVLPDQSTIRDLLQTILISTGGEGAIMRIVQNISEHHFTCMAVDDRINLFRSLSIAIRYIVTNPLETQVVQIQTGVHGIIIFAKQHQSNWNEPTRKRV